MNITFYSPRQMPAVGDSPGAHPGALGLLLADGARPGSIGKKLDSDSGGAISRAIRAVEFKASDRQLLSLPGLPRLPGRVILAGLGKTPKERQLENAGGLLAGSLNKTGITDLTIVLDAGISRIPPGPAAAHIALGVCLRAYRFDAYQTDAARKNATTEKGGEKEGKETDRKKPPLKNITIICADAAAARREWKEIEPVVSGVTLARDLVNEPPNVLTPEEFAKRIKKLSRLGVRVTILDEKKMAALGMNALLGVGQGSKQPSRLAVMHWTGGRASQAPVALVGKGVCFDTGGISLKPPASMDEMKGDMAGAACVTGVMQALAMRRARANVVGIAALVENMPGSNAQRPGDIVTSMSGQTIEILNTDAEGRLVLADALCYVCKKFKPDMIIDLATLTGAILVTLGKEYAGLFSNDDTLSRRLIAAGDAEGEKLWRLPLDKAFDKMIDSSVADMKNIGGRYAGSITAAQFLQRFVGKTPWAHLDIAGTAFSSPMTPVNQSWGSGFGVRLLNRLIADHCEGPGRKIHRKIRKK